MSYKQTIRIPLSTRGIDSFYDEDSNLVYLLSADGALNIVSVAEHKVVKSLVLRDNPAVLTYDKTNNNIIVAHASTSSTGLGYLSIINVDTQKSIPTINIGINCVPSQIFIDYDSQLLHVVSTNVTSTVTQGYQFVRSFDISDNYSAVRTLTVKDISSVRYSRHADLLRSSTIVTTTTTRHPLAFQDLYIVSSEDSKLEKLSTSTDTVSDVKSLDAGSFPQRLSLNSSSDLVFITNYKKPFISVVDINTPSNSIANVAAEEGVCDIQVDSANNLIYYINNLSDEFVCYNYANSTVVAKVDLPHLPTDLSLDLANSRAYVTNNLQRTLYEINLSDFTYETYALSFAPFSMFLDENSELIYLCDFDTGGVYTFDRFSKTVSRIDFNFGKTINVAYNSDTSILYAISSVGDITAYHTGTRKLVARFLNRDNVEAGANAASFPSSLAIDSVAKILYVANSLGNTISMYNLRNHTFMKNVASSKFPDGLLLNNRPTTTTTVAPTTATLTIGSSSNFIADNYVVFYGNTGDEIEYEEIVTVSDTNSMSEIIIEKSGSALSRITLPTEYITGDKPFNITIASGVHAGTYSNLTFGDGSLSSGGNYRSITLS